MIGIYTITENATGKVYVGQSIVIEKRWRTHQKTRPLEGYSYKVEQECCIGLLDVMERHFIKKWNTLTPHGLNRTTGGTGHFGHFDDDARANMSAAAKGKTISDETKQKMSEAHKGKIIGPRSDETKAKISAAKKGKPRTKRNE